MFEGQN